MHARMLITGVGEPAASELSNTLEQLGHSVIAEPFLSVSDALESIDRSAADLVFCSAVPEVYESVLDSLRRKGREVPVVVISELPDVDKWLDALDAGACDYAVRPFEPRLMRSVVDNALTYRGPLTIAS